MRGHTCVCIPLPLPFPVLLLLPLVPLAPHPTATPRVVAVCAAWLVYVVWLESVLPLRLLKA
ncbi:hypothetical protein C8R45DRAFT_1013987 [Mycena sanguinolenta]|nr:hypothetical protein C8R45DRAFT_1013987 [Mycena sanguinolenta]